MTWESFLDKTVDSDALKKNLNTPQLARLERRAQTQAQAKVETNRQQNIVVNANIEAEKAPTDTEKSTQETEEAINDAEKAKYSTK